MRASPPRHAAGAPASGRLPAAGSLYDGGPRFRAAGSSVAKRLVEQRAAVGCAEGQPRDRAATEQWWRNFNDPALDRLVAEAQREEQRRAHGRPAHSRGARRARHRRQRFVSATAATQWRGAARRPAAVERPRYRRLALPRRPRHRGNWTSGASSGAASSLRMLHFAIASYDDAQVLVRRRPPASTPPSAPSNSACIAHENAALQKRSLEITERLFKSGNESELDVQQARTQYLSTVASIPELEGSVRQVQNALSVLLARPPGPLPEMEAGREDSDGRARGHRRPARRPAAPPTGRACGGGASRRAVGSDWRQ